MALHQELATNKPLHLDEFKNVLVLGAGNFGTCLAYHLATVSHDVTIYARDPVVVESINKDHTNSKYMKNVKLPANLKATGSLTKEVYDANHVLLFAIPTEHLRATLTSMKPLMKPDHLIILANKSLSPPFVIVEEVLGKETADRVVFLSGPSFAAEVVEKQPTMVCAASKIIAAARYAQQIFHSPQFRVYTSDDPIGVEIAGAMKNVIAIGSGISSGVGFQMNTRAALITRGLAEMTRIGVAMGANPLTFMGLAGVGDLFLTCSSEKSRNFTVGYRLGKGESLEQAVYLLARKLNVDTPITDHLPTLTSVRVRYGILYEKKPIREAVEALLRRVASAEY